jgi:hypothetical protein
MLNNHNRKKLREFWSGTEDTEILSPRTMGIFSPDTILYLIGQLFTAVKSARELVKGFTKP